MINATFFYDLFRSMHKYTTTLFVFFYLLGCMLIAAPFVFEIIIFAVRFGDRAARQDGEHEGVFLRLARGK